jgi:hypothetical protein
MLSILAVLAAPGHCRVAAGLGMWMATRHPGVRRWRVEPVDRPQEINATTSHTYRRHAPGGGLPLPLHQRSVDFLGAGDSPARPIAKGGVELPGGMAGREAIVQLLGLRSQGHIFGAGLSEGARAKGRERRGESEGAGESAQVPRPAERPAVEKGQTGLRGVLPPDRASAGRTA